jgi:hypothetical protein
MKGVIRRLCRFEEPGASPEVVVPDWALELIMRVGSGAGRTARSHDVSGREIGGGAGGAIAYSGWRCGIGPHFWW